jgi:hypothetical protein
VGLVENGFGITNNRRRKKSQQATMNNTNCGIPLKKWHF